MFHLYLSISCVSSWSFPAALSVLVFSSQGESRAKYYLTEPTPVQVKHKAIEFIMEPFHPPGPFLQTMKMSAQ